MSTGAVRRFEKCLFRCLFLGLWSIGVAVLSVWLTSWYVTSPTNMHSEANQVVFESLEFADALRFSTPVDGKPVPLAEIAEVLERPEFSHLRNYGFKLLPKGKGVIASLVVNQHFEILFFGSGNPSIHNRNIELE